MWLPYSVDAPAVYGETLHHLDRIADEVEIARLKDMHVLEHEEAQQDLQQLGSDLTAKFVRTWRRKERDGKEQWLRRSRLVAREFNRMDLRDDLFSPASNHVVERLLPALAVSQVLKDTFVLGSLDIGDAYLQVHQANRRRVGIMDYPSEFQLLICRCLPGQRDGSRRWFDFFADYLVRELHLEQCAEQPAMFLCRCFTYHYLTPCLLVENYSKTLGNFSSFMLKAWMNTQMSEAFGSEKKYIW